jgi:hypothetical protein
LRWWEIYNYYYLTDFGKKELPDLHICLDNALKTIMENQFTSERIFKGCCFKQCGTVGDNAISDEDIICLITKVSQHIDSHGCIEKGIALKWNETHDQNSLATFNAKDDESIDIDHGFGGTAETITILSPNHLLPGEVATQKGRCNSLQNTEDYHLVMGMIEAAKTQEQKMMMRNLVYQLTTTFLAQNRSNTVSQTDTTFLGEDDSKGHRSGKRHKQLHENWPRRNNN